MYDKQTLLVCDEDGRALLGAKQEGAGGVYVQGAYIETANIAGIYPVGEFEDRSRQFLGILHDGSRAVRQFGRWYDPAGSKDDQGRLEVAYDPYHYPEVGLDCVPTPEEFMSEYAHLPARERLARMVGGEENLRRLARHDGMTRIAEILGSPVPALAEDGENSEAL